MKAQLSQVVDVLRGFRFRYSDEDQLQEGLAEALRSRGFDVRREVRLNARDRIDLLVGRVGVEVKVGGTAADLRRQLERYARSDQVDALAVVTSRVRHLEVRRHGLIEGKPVEIVSLAEAGL